MAGVSDPQPNGMVPDEFIARIVTELNPLEIWLFGSRARAAARPDSDWDLMVVLPDDAREDSSTVASAKVEDLELVPVWKRLHDLRLQGVELFPITRTDFDRWRTSLGTLAQIVASEGVVVYAR